MIIKGSLSYTTSGRRKKRLKKTRKHYEFKELKTTKENKILYPSRAPKTDTTSKMRFPTVHSYTVAIPYNKGAYQVIPESDIRYIGK